MQSTRNLADIAIIGMACRVSGANNPSELWEVLATSAETLQEIKRYHAAGFYSSYDGDKSGLTNVKHGYFLQNHIDEFDHTFFDISPGEAAAMDPQHRILLEVAYEAFENAGIPLENLAGTSTGVFSGLSGSDYSASLLRDIDALPKYHSTGSSIAMAANRISYHFDLRGPSIVTDTACSSSAVALHQAILSLKAKDCSMALVTGSNLILNPDAFIHMSSLGFLSPDGICHSFDKAANGYGRGEGVLAILLKPLAQALKDGDSIRSIIRGSAINQDGHTNGITLPSASAQEHNMKSVYSSSNISPSQVQYVEAHGTGTAVGDPIEVSSINKVFNESFRHQKLIVGSVKSNIGHLEAAAALAGVIKTVECLQRRKIPPQKHFVQPNPSIDFSSILIPTNIMPWPDTHGGPRRAAVNSFGFGGTNGHIILEHWSDLEISSFTQPGERPYLFKVSAASEVSLVELATKYAQYISSKKPDLAILAHTTLTRRSTLAKSQYIISSTHDDLISQLDNALSNSTWNKTAGLNHPLGFIFTGQGAQWPAMGTDLMTYSSLFRSVIDSCDEVLASIPDKPEWSLRLVLARPSGSSSIDIPSVSQTACTALQIGLIEVWKSWGVLSRFAIGHSSGEIAACYAAGAYSLRDAILIAYYRGKVVQAYRDTSTVAGSMCAIGLGPNDCITLLEETNIHATIAAINSPMSCTVSGNQEAIDQLIATCKERQIFHRRLRVDIAYHSSHMNSVAIKYRAILDEVIDNSCDPSGRIKNFTCEVFSTLLGRRLLLEDLNSGYWARNLCDRVQFSTAIEAAAEYYRSTMIFVEIGPHPALKSAVSETLSFRNQLKFFYFKSCQRGHSSYKSMLESASEMIASGIGINASEMNSAEYDKSVGDHQRLPGILIDLPTYSWDHSRSHWMESRASQQLRFREFPHHSILGSRAFGDNPSQMLWRNHLTTADLLVIKEATIGSHTVSVALCIIMALEAATQVSQKLELENSPFAVKDLEFHEPINVSDFHAKPTETCLSLVRDVKSDKYALAISVLSGDPKTAWTICCTGIVEYVTNRVTQDKLHQSLPKNDARILRYIESLGIFDMAGFQSLCVEGSQMAGRIITDKPAISRYMQLLSLATVLQVPEMLMMSSDALSRHRIHKISSLQVLYQDNETEAGSFRGKQIRLSPLKSSSRLVIRSASGAFMDLEGVQTKVHALFDFKPPPQSLFLRAKLLPDIIILQQSEPMDVTALLQLISHKWPMCDIGLADVSEEDFSQVHDFLATSARAEYRSINVMHSDHFHRYGVRIPQDLEKELVHLTFSTASWIACHLSILHVSGLACVYLGSESDEHLFHEHFNLICSIIGISEDRWALGRRKSLAKDKESLELSIQVFTTIDSMHLKNLKHSGIRICALDTQEEAQVGISGPQKSEFNPHIIVLDCAEKSVLLSSTNTTVISWLQPLLVEMRSLVWVTRGISSNPFCDVASSFIKTLLSENPLLAATNLIVEDVVSSTKMLELALDAHRRLMRKWRETEIIIRKSRVLITRYRPDDRLSATVGVIPPLRTIGNLANHDHEVVQAYPKTVILRAEKGFQTATFQDNQLLRVRIVASVVDHIDILLVEDEFTLQNSKYKLGHFFAGTVEKCNHANTMGLTQVVGWYAGSHCSKVHVEASKLLPIPDGMDANYAVAHIAAYSFARALIDGVVRPLQGEKILIKVPGIVGEALQKVCKSLNIATFHDHSVECEIVLEFDINIGFIVNNKPVGIEKYLGIEYLHKVSDFMSTNFMLGYHLQIFNFTEIRNAFECARNSPGSTILSHLGDYQSTESWIFAAQKLKLFREDATYVILGGLGGLGKHLMLWMISRGAKHLVSMSRRGIETPEARDIVHEAQTLGCNIMVLTVDACNQQSLREAISHVRSIRPIRGYFNMAMQLANSLFSTMTAKQWSDAVRTKVESSWNLHQLSLGDHLDFFVMFSSVSSISGNRSQANYAVGNAFQNSLAKHRRSLRLTGTSIVLGAMKGLGVLAKDDRLLGALSRSGLCCYDSHDFDKIVEAALNNSLESEDSMICTGLRRFTNVDGFIQVPSDRSQIFWCDWPEFGFLFDYQRSDTVGTKPKTLLEKLNEASDTERQVILYTAFTDCLADILGRKSTDFIPEMSIASYGLDSLTTVACRYWFFENLGIDVSVFDILACKTIKELLVSLINQLNTQASSISTPIAYSKSNLKHRPLSHSQRRIWFMQQYLQDKTLNNLVLECEVIGHINVEVFSQSWSFFVRRHGSLHSRYAYTSNGLQQLLVEDHCFPLTLVTSSADEFENSCAIARLDSTSYHFDLESGDLVRGWLVLSQAGQARFFLASHHIAWDRSSVETIFKETSTIYSSIKNLKDPGTSLDNDIYHIVDYALWEEAWLKREHLVEEHLEYWKNQLANMPQAVSLFPMANVRTRPEVKTYEYETLQSVIYRDVANQVQNFCQLHSITPFMLMTSTLALLVTKLTGDMDVIIGIADGHRSHSAFDGLVGFTVNLLAIRTKLESVSTRYHDFLGQYRETCLHAYKHRALPFDVLLHQLQIPRSANHSQIFQIVVNYQSAGEFRDCDYGDFKFTNYSHHNAKPQTDFRLDVEEEESGDFRCIWTYDSSLYTREGFLQISLVFQSLLRNILQSVSHSRISDLDLSIDQTETSEDCEKNLVSRLKEMDDTNFYDFFARAVLRYPEKTAIIARTGSVTYKELDQYTAKVARHLRLETTTSGSNVAIYCPEGTEMAIGIYGVLRAGLTYVPLDTELPEERLQQILLDANIGFILIGACNCNKLSAILRGGIHNFRLGRIEELATDKSSMTSTIKDQYEEISDGFCCIFTSGTTGVPKGIVVGRRQLRYQMQSYHDFLCTDASDIMLLCSSPAFDMSLASIYGTILRGATLVIADREMRLSPPQLLQFAIQNQVTNCALTTTQLKFLLSAGKDQFLGWISLQSLVVGGEEVPEWIIPEFYGLGLPNATLYNGYGPTETTVCNSLGKISPNIRPGEAIGVGKPLFPARFCLLDEDLKVVPPGQDGQLYIAGAVLNDGYLNRQELTVASFIEDPRREATTKSSLLYKTGDLARMTTSGEYIILGRIHGDRQVKIRGIRTELGEVEESIRKVLNSLDKYSYGISMVSVVYLESKSILAAFMMGRLVTDTTEDQVLRKVRSALKTRLATHMIPSELKVVLELPQTMTGKLDYNALKAFPHQKSGPLLSESLRSTCKQKADFETDVARIWQNVIGIDTHPSLDDDFFSLGGHSLLLLQVQKQISEKLGCAISIVDIFTNSTLRSLSRVVSDSSQTVSAIEASATSNCGTSSSENTQSFNSEHTKQYVDWAHEMRLPQELIGHPNRIHSSFQATTSSEAVAIVGACTMAGAQLLSHILMSTSLEVHCIAVKSSVTSTEDPTKSVMFSLCHWGLLEQIPDEKRRKLFAWSGTLSDQYLGLNADAIKLLKRKVKAIYIMESDVSLLKSYEDLRASNVESLRYLISLACSSTSTPMEIHYLSTWGVPHLQTWNGTKRLNDALVRREAEMAHMEPSNDNALGYLKARWVCEGLLCKAASLGYPVSIYRSCMCASSPDTETPLDQQDINRRILEGILQTGLVPDFRSAEGGGMSWISADFLVESMFYLSQSKPACVSEAQIYHIVSDTHIPYDKLPEILKESYAGVPLRVVKPQEWFKALKNYDNLDIKMHAEVLETWTQAGWLPFQLDANLTQSLLKNRGFIPPTINKSFLMKHVIGEKGF